MTFGESLSAVMLPEIGEDLDSAVSSLSTFAAATEGALSSALARCQQATGTQSCRQARAEQFCEACTSCKSEMLVLQKCTARGVRQGTVASNSYNFSPYCTPLTADGAPHDSCTSPAGLLGLPELQLVADEGLARFAGRLQVKITLTPPEFPVCMRAQPGKADA